MPTPTVQRLEGKVERLDDLMRRWSNARWAAPGRDGRARADIAYELATSLAELARQAGSGAPAVEPPRVGPHAIADQLLVLGRELTSAPDLAANAAVMDAAEAAVERAVNSF